jgi:hypothetical protein
MLNTTSRCVWRCATLQRQLGLQRYETAWMTLHELRRAVVNLARDPLWGEVEVDETWVEGTQADLRAVANLRAEKLHWSSWLWRNVAALRDASGGHIGFQRHNADRLRQNVAPGSTRHTDGLKSFTGLQEAGFKHVPRS